MIATKNVSMKYSGQRRLPGLLSAAIAGVLLGQPAFAQTGGGGVLLHGFADVGFALNSGGNPAGNPNGFNVGSFDLYMTPHFDNDVKGLVELIFRTTPDGSLVTDLERVQMGYTFNDNATVWAGRFHTPYGYWNTAFHHGAQIQTSVMRPRFLDFEDEDGIFPAHMVGVWGTGKVKAGEGYLTYDAFVGNGPKIQTAINSNVSTAGMLRPNVAGDNNHSAMAGLNVGYEFSGNLDSLRVAGHWFKGDVDDDSVNIPGYNKTGVNMVGGSAVYLTNDWEVLGEYYRFNNKDKSGATGSHKSWADYLQVGKSFDDLTPFVRLEKAVLDQLDNYFSMQANGQSYTRQALGLKYDLDQKAALKFELLHSGFTGRTAYSYRSLFAQYAIRF